MSTAAKYRINVTHLLPKQEIGSSNDAVAVKLCLSDDIADLLYDKLSKKLLKIGHWNVKAGKTPTKFYLLDQHGNEGFLFAEEKMLVKIRMPIKNSTGNGYDWVVIEKIRQYREEHLSYLLIQMRPCPCAENNDGGIAHFYHATATNSFILVRSGSEIQMSVHGRNESPNTSNMNIFSLMRNLFVASGGIFGGSKLQWETFVNEMIENK